MNWAVIFSTAVVLVLLVIFLVRRNQKDEQEFEQQLNNDYRKTKNEEADVDTEN